MKVRYTVPSAVTRAAYVGNGATTVFSAPFNFFDDSDLYVVLVNDTTAVETVQVLTTNYTVTGGDGSTGSVTMLTAPPTGTTLVIERDVPFTQEIDLEPNDPFPAEVTEEGFDRSVMLAQQNRLEIQKSPKLPPTYDPDSDPEIRIPVPEAGKVLVGNSGATGWENTAIADLSVATIPTTISGLANRDLLEYESAGATWKNQSLATILKRMLTTAGDIAVNIAGTVSRLAIGTAGQVLGVSGGAPAWITLEARRAIADVAATVTSADCVIAYTSLTAPRSVTLPHANTFRAGQRLVIVDDSGSASQTIALSVVPNTTNTIAGSNTTQVVVNVPRGRCVLVSDGVGAWSVLEWSVRYISVLGANVNLTNTGTYFDGPSVAQGVVGTWRAVSKACVTSGGIANVNAKLWDGTTVVDSGRETVAGASQAHMLPMSGDITNPAGNIKISVNDATRTDGTLQFNFSGNNKDTSLLVWRIA